MLFFAVLITAVIVYIIQSKIYERHAFDSLSYDVKLSAEEVFEGEDIFMYEELCNGKNLPIPSIRIDTELPEGLYFRFTDKSGRKNQRDSLSRVNQSAFVLKSAQCIRRRWRVNCKKRGIYTPGRVLMVTNDLFGFNALSKSLEVPKGRKNSIVVLPRPVELDGAFSSSHYLSGDVSVPRSLISDPLLISGSREYTPLDPMSKINWNSTASHGRLMVNIEDFTEQHTFNIILNMQSRPIELHRDTPSSPEYIENCITVAASIIDRVSASNIPVRMFINTPPKMLGLDVDGDISVTKAYRGKGETIEALRLLAALEMQISCPADKMLDTISKNPYFFSNGGNIIIVSAYIDERMIVFHDIMRRAGIRVMFYVTEANQNAMTIPSNIEVFYNTYLERRAAND